MMRSVRLRLVVAVAVSAPLGCGDGGTGTLVVHASGEEAAQEGYPVELDDEVLAFVDGWSLQFEAVVLSYTSFELRDADGDAVALEATPVVADLSRGEPELWRFEGVPSGRWENVTYRVAPPTPESEPVGDVAAAHLDVMRDEGYGVWIEATAEHGDDTVEVAFGFPMDVSNARCHNGLDGTDGVVIRRGGIVQSELTMHLDHLFLDRLAGGDASMRFEPMAGAATDEGQVTLDDLAAQSLSDLRDREGDPITEEGEPILYDPGSHALDPHDLRQFVLAAATTMGHFNGEGHCHYTRN